MIAGVSCRGARAMLSLGKSVACSTRVLAAMHGSVFSMTSQSATCAHAPSFSTASKLYSSVDDLSEAEFVPMDSNGMTETTPPMLDEFGRSYATGRRKTSVARVWIKEGSGQFSVNGKTLANYFLPLHREECLLPFVVTSTAGLYDVMCTVKGGGMGGQAGAIRHGVTKALLNFSNAHRPALKAAGFITRDSRRVERKKPGQPKARKKFQWVKR